MTDTEDKNLDLLSVEEAAAYLKFSTAFLYKLCKENKIPHVNYARHILFRKSDLYNSETLSYTVSKCILLHFNDLCN